MKIQQMVMRSHGWQEAGTFVLAHRIRMGFAIFLMLSGASNILSTFFPVEVGRLGWVQFVFYQCAPSDSSLWALLRLGRSVSLLSGLFLFLLAFGLARGKKQAWRVSICLLPISALVHLTRGGSGSHILIALLLWVGLVVLRAFFEVESDPWHMAQGVKLLFVGCVVLILYILIGLLLLQDQFVFPSTIEAGVYAIVQRAVGLHSDALVPLTRHANWFLRSIFMLSMGVVFSGVLLLFRPVSLRWCLANQQMAQFVAQQKTSSLMKRCGEQTLAFFALRVNILKYIAPLHDGFVAYRLSGSTVVTLGEPVCEKESYERVTRAFLNDCKKHDWQPTFYQVRPERLDFYRSLGFHTFKIGEEAILDLQTFKISGNAMSNVRSSSKKAEKEGVSVHWYEGVPPADVLSQIESVSRAWLTEKGQKQQEMGFSMGRFCEVREMAARSEQLVQGDRSLPRYITGVCLDRDNRICAVVTFTPIYGTLTVQGKRENWGWSLDLMRRSPEAPYGVMEFMLVGAIERFKAQGAPLMSLGLVAMADTSEEIQGYQRQVANFLSEHSEILQSHRSLFSFKRKFRPRWESRYLVVGSMFTIPKVALALLHVHQS